MGIHPFPSGLFWTVPIANDSVDVDLEDGTASLRVTHQTAMDFGSIPNSLNNGPSVAARISYDLEWSGILSRNTVHDPTKGFEGSFVQTNATINWTAQTATGFHFSSADTGQKTVFAQIGHERNGVFFH